MKKANNGFEPKVTNSKKGKKANLSKSSGLNLSKGLQNFSPVKGEFDELYLSSSESERTKWDIFKRKKEICREVFDLFVYMNL